VQFKDRILQGAGNSRGRADGANDDDLRGVAGDNEPSDQDVIARADKDTRGNINCARRWREEEKMEGSDVVRLKKNLPAKEGPQRRKVFSGIESSQVNKKSLPSCYRGRGYTVLGSASRPPCGLQQRTLSLGNMRGRPLQSH